MWHQRKFGLAPRGARAGLDELYGESQLNAASQLSQQTFPQYGGGGGAAGVQSSPPPPADPHARRSLSFSQQDGPGVSAANSPSPPSLYSAQNSYSDSSGSQWVDVATQQQQSPPMSMPSRFAHAGGATPPTPPPQQEHAAAAAAAAAGRWGFLYPQAQAEAAAAAAAAAGMTGREAQELSTLAAQVAAQAAEVRKLAGSLEKRMHDRSGSPVLKQLRAAVLRQHVGLQERVVNRVREAAAACEHRKTVKTNNEGDNGGAGGGGEDDDADVMGVGPSVSQRAADDLDTPPLTPEAAGLQQRLEDRLTHMQLDAEVHGAAEVGGSPLWGGGWGDGERLDEMFTEGVLRAS